MAPKPQPGRSEFRSAMKALKPYLPINYGVLLQETHPELDFYRLRQAVALRCVYWEGIEALRTVQRAEPVLRKPRKKHERRHLVAA